LLGTVGREDHKQGGCGDSLYSWSRFSSAPQAPPQEAAAAAAAFGPPALRSRSAAPWPSAAAAPPARREAAAALFDLLRRERHSLDNLSPALKEELLRRLDKVHAEDLGVQRCDPQRLCGRAGIGYQEVYSSPEMTLCVFVLRAGAHIPLHDHPEMHVFGRLLFGRMRVLSLDPEPVPPEGWGSSSGSGALAAGAKWATIRTNTVFGPAPVTYCLGPCEGNLHEIHALEDCAFFDVVAPPYDNLAGRSCTYYAPAANSTGQQPEGGGYGAGKCLLVPTTPHGFFTEPLKYSGPPFMMSAQGTLANASGDLG